MITIIILCLRIIRCANIKLRSQWLHFVNNIPPIHGARLIFSTLRDLKERFQHLLREIWLSTPSGSRRLSFRSGKDLCIILPKVNKKADVVWHWSQYQSSQCDKIEIEIWPRIKQCTNVVFFPYILGLFRNIWIGTYYMFPILIQRSILIPTFFFFWRSNTYDLRRTSHCANNEGERQGTKKQERSYLQPQPTDHMLSCRSHSDECEEHSETPSVSCNKILAIIRHLIKPITKEIQNQRQ